MSKWLCDIRRLYLCQNQCAHITYGLLHHPQMFPDALPGITRLLLRNFAPAIRGTGMCMCIRYVYYIYMPIAIGIQKTDAGTRPAALFPKKKMLYRMNLLRNEIFFNSCAPYERFYNSNRYFCRMGALSHEKNNFRYPSIAPAPHARFMGYTRVFFISSFVHLAWRALSKH